ncbi:MAG: GNAT family N-acetyltransferase [Firmicutes bacterium]|nr:GNAT family N-acetyltransferase [Bacillota bacterium]
MNFIISRADIPRDIILVTDLILTVYDQLPPERKAWFVVDEAEYTHQILADGRAWAYKAVDTDTQELAGVFTVIFPGLSEHNLGYDVGLTAEQLPLVAHMDTAAVLSPYRGHHLQHRMMALAEEDLKKAGYRYLCVTAHPDNHYSGNNMLSLGYQIITTKEKYGGFLRNIFMKEV